MSTVHVKITIDAPVERVWETIMDPRRLGEWVTIHRRLKEAPADPQKQGATMEQVLHIRGVSFHRPLDARGGEGTDARGMGRTRTGPFKGADPLRVVGR